MSIYRRSLLFFIVLAVFVIGGSLYGFSQKDAAIVVQSLPEEKRPVEFAVYVCGAVQKPGVVYVAENSRVIEAIKRCGGTLPTADLTKVNMAQVVQDGMQVTIPEKPMEVVVTDGKSSPAAPAVASKVGNSAGKVNINTADQTELDRLPGVGPAIAAAIIEYRNTEGAFQSLDDLMKVKGIGEAKFNRLKEKATL